MTTAITRLSGSAFELTLTLPWSDVKKIYDEVFEELAAEIEVEGFRKGKAPREIIEGKIDKGKVYGEVVNRVLPQSYSQALTQHNLKPVISPRVQIQSAEENKDWQFIVKAAEKPTVDLGSYQDAVKSLTAKDKIWVPGKDAKSDDSEKKDSEEKEKKISSILDKLLEVCNVDLAEIILESEVNRLLTQLIDDVRGAGLTFEQYLQSSSQTQENLRQRYKEQAEKTLKLEFILEAIADDLQVEVSAEEIKAVTDKEQDATKRKALEEQSYILASILRREKTVTKLLSL